MIRPSSWRKTGCCPRCCSAARWGRNRRHCFCGSIRRGAAHRTLSAAGIAQYCHYVFADWHDMDSSMMNLITEADREGQTLPAICRLALSQDAWQKERNFSEKEAAQRSAFYLPSAGRDRVPLLQAVCRRGTGTQAL